MSSPPPPKAEKHFNNARTPKHANRGVRREGGGPPHTAERVAHETPRSAMMPPSPHYYNYYYPHHPAMSRGPPPMRGYYDYYDRPHFDRYQRDPYYEMHHPRPHDNRPRGESLDCDPAERAAGGMNASSNHYLRAISSSFSANGSLQKSVGKDDGGVEVCKPSPGVVTAVDSLEETKETTDIPQPPSLSSKSTLEQQLKPNPSSSPHSDSSWKQLQQIASIETKNALEVQPSQSEESEKVDKEVAVPTPVNKSSPNGGHGLEKSISRTSSLSNSPTEEEFTEQKPFDDKDPGIQPSASEEHYRSYYEARTGHPYPHEARYPPHYPRKHHPLHTPPSMPYPHHPPMAAPYDEASPSASTISTKDTRSFFPPSIMKPKHPVHFKKDKGDDASPANASDFGDIGAMPSWDKNFLGGSVCSGITGMESLIKNDVTLSAFSFGSELSKKKEEDESPKSGKKRNHVQFAGEPVNSGPRKRPPPGRYPPHPDPHHPYEPSPPNRYPPRHYREYEEDPYYAEHGYPPRYYDYRYRPPPPPYPYRPEYDYPRGAPGPHSRPAFPPHIHAAPSGGCGKWSQSDDYELMDIMKKQGNVKNWDPIAAKLNRGKSGKECQDRWIRFLRPGSRKGQWTEAEDRIVLETVTNSIEEPFTRWSDLANKLPGRIGKQVRDRWVNHLNPAINHLPFSREDDLKLWDAHHTLGKRWVEISSTIFHGERSENHVKNRWYSAAFKKFICGEFGPDAYRIGNEKGCAAGGEQHDASEKESPSSIE